MQAILQKISIKLKASAYGIFSAGNEIKYIVKRKKERDLLETQLVAELNAKTSAKSGFMRIPAIKGFIHNDLHR